jgi:hypothetical protein
MEDSMMFAETVMAGSLNGRFRLALQNANENYGRMFRDLEEFRHALKRWMNTRMQPLKDKEALHNLRQHKPHGLERFLEQFQFIALELKPNSEEVLEQLGRALHPDCAYNLVSKVTDGDIVTLDQALDYLKKKNITITPLEGLSCCSLAVFLRPEIWWLWSSGNWKLSTWMVCASTRCSPCP